MNQSQQSADRLRASPAPDSFPSSIAVADVEAWLAVVSEGWQRVAQHLLRQRNTAGHWEGCLSSSALSTATAIMALDAYQRAGQGTPAQRSLWHSQCDAGRRWLLRTQNADGGWGDTPVSLSNISTTALAWAALPPDDSRWCSANDRCEAWLLREVNASLERTDATLQPIHLAEAIKRRYGKDHTFSVPILTALALHDRLGVLPDAWRLVPQLPFELAAFPRAWYAKLKLRVVSYALPALIAIGLVRFRQFPGWHGPRNWLRRGVTARVLEILREIQPASGGFLEAIPLTSFVSLSLIRAGWSQSPVVIQGVAFLERAARPDGSWAIDSNLATWTSTLAISSLTRLPDTELPGWDETAQQRLRSWLLGQQYTTVHPFTRAAAGGWAWTDLPGGVPDADDTPGALLALAKLGGGEYAHRAARAGAAWLLGTQNSDGGMPTFCRGWGQLPFDRSSADLTAHALRAWQVWLPHLAESDRRRVLTAIGRGIDFLLRSQRSDGAWVPLWFGNQHLEEEENPVYGTSRVLLAWAEVAEESVGAMVRRTRWEQAAIRGWCWLLQQQNHDGGWGGGVRRDGQPTPTSLEETGLALDAMSRCLEVATRQARPVSAEIRTRSWIALERGTRRLLELTQTDFSPAPIGFYFAKLWYYESLYPIVFGLQGLGGVVQCLRLRLAAVQDEG